MLSALLPAAISAATSIIGGNMAQKKQEEIADKNIALQKEFAQSGIQWKAADAKAAGIHPLYALGANTTSFAPVSVGSPLGDSVRSMGQDISRAVTATSTQPQRAGAFQNAVMALDLENKSLNNDLLRSQIARIRANTNPAMPEAVQPSASAIPGQPDTYTTSANPGQVKIKPQDLTQNPRDPSQEPAPVPDRGWAWTGTGWAPIPSKDVKERIEDVGPAEWMWSYRNMMLPNFAHTPHPANIAVPPDQQMVWNYPKQEWQLRQKEDWRIHGGNFMGRWILDPRSVRR